MKDFRHHRLELIALGMAIAKTGDRERVLESIDLEHMSSPLVSHCLKAVKSLDAEDVQVARGIFRNWGVKVGSSVSESLIASVNLNNARRRLSLAVDEATSGAEGVEVDDAIKEVEECLNRLREIQASKGAAI